MPDFSFVKPVFNLHIKISYDQCCPRFFRCMPCCVFNLNQVIPPEDMRDRKVEKDIEESEKMKSLRRNNSFCHENHARFKHKVKVLKRSASF